MALSSNVHGRLLLHLGLTSARRSDSLVAGGGRVGAEGLAPGSLVLDRGRNDVCEGRKVSDGFSAVHLVTSLPKRARPRRTVRVIQESQAKAVAARPMPHQLASQKREERKAS